MVVIVGASGHGKVVLSTAVAKGENVTGFLDDHLFLQTNTVEGYPILGKINCLQSQIFPHATFAIGRNKVRQILAEKYHPHVSWKTIIHPQAYVHPTVKIGQGTVIFAGAIIQPYAVIGDHCIINTGATIDHDCVIGDYVHLAPGVHLAGGVTIGKGAFLGIGSVVIQELSIGDWTTVGAGGAVIHSIPSHKMVMGVPAKEKS